jgi:hypothetical protein
MADALLAVLAAYAMAIRDNRRPLTSQESIAPLSVAANANR